MEPYEPRRTGVPTSYIARRLLGIRSDRESRSFAAWHREAAALLNIPLTYGRVPGIREAAALLWCRVARQRGLPWEPLLTVARLFLAGEDVGAALLWHKGEHAHGRELLRLADAVQALVQTKGWREINMVPSAAHREERT